MDEKKPEMAWVTHVVYPFVVLGDVEDLADDARKEAERFQKDLEEAAIFARWRRKHIRVS
jgi:hypothetical protein